MNAPFFMIVLAVVVLYLSPLRAQEKKYTELTPREILNDFDLMVDILQKQHPNVYKFTDARAFRRGVDSLRNRIAARPDLITLTANSPLSLLRDVHLSLSLSEGYNRDMLAALSFFPFPVIIERGRMFINMKEGNIPFGSEIISINDETVKDILESLKGSFPPDGYISSGTDRLYTNFQLYYSLSRRGVNVYHIAYLEQGKSAVCRKEVEGISPATWYQTTRKSILPLNVLQQEFNIYPEFMESEQTGVLTVNTFNLSEEKAYKEFSDFFREVNKRRYKKVIIDVRRNGGGDPGISALLYSFLAKGPFRNVYNYRTKTIGIAYPEHVVDYNKRRLSEEDIRDRKNFFYQRFDKDSMGFYKGNARLMEGLLENFPPDKDAFHGRVFVLTGGATASAASYFASLVQKNKRGTVIGKETGSGEASTTAGWFLDYLLPGTKSVLTVPRTEIYYFNADVDNGRGVVPDVQIPMSYFIAHFCAGKDPEMSYALQSTE